MRDHCITCGDVAEPMTVLKIDADRGLALCSDAAGVHHTVEIALVLPIAVDDVLLVHAGTAIAAGPAPAAPGRESTMQGPRRSRGQGVRAEAEDVAE